MPNNIPLGMVVNELVTNAVKYAYPSPQRGNIGVRFHKTDTTYTLEIGDSGVGLPENAVSHSGLGTKLVNSLVQQAGGQLTVKHHPGVTYSIRVPVTATNGSSSLSTL